MYLLNRNIRHDRRRDWRILGKRQALWLVILALVLSFLTSSSMRAEQSPPFRIKETVTIDRVGDANFNLDIKLPTALYTYVKVNNPNTALLLRRLGLSYRAYWEHQDIKGSFDDGTSTVRLQWTTRGFARIERDDLWQVPVGESDGIEVIAVHDNEVILSAAAQTPYGLATLTVRGILPSGSRDVQPLRSPFRVVYRTPAPETSPGNQTALDFTFQAKPQVMSCLAPSYGTGLSDMWVARTILKNTGDQIVKDYRVRFRIAGYTLGWSPWQRCQEVVPGQTVVDAYFPVFDLEKVGQLNGTRQTTLEMEYQYQRAGGRLVQETDNRIVKLLGRNEVIFSSLSADEAVGFHDLFNYGPAILASFVTRDDPLIQQVAGWVSGQAGGVAATRSDEEAVQFLAALYEFMGINGIAYQTPPGAKFNGQFGQHVKYGRDVLQNRAGTCVDLAIFYGSVCEAVGLRPVLFLIPGHCFPAIYLPKSGTIFAVEATGVGKVDFLQAVNRGTEERNQALQQGPALTVNIRDLRDKGFRGLELPPLPPSTLRDWGIHPVERRNAQTTSSPAQRQTAQTSFSPRVGGWATGVWYYNGQIKGATVFFGIGFRDDGVFCEELTVTYPNGKSSTVSQGRGTYELNSREIALTYTDGKRKGQHLARPYQFSEGRLWMTIKEIGYQLPLTRHN
jgi:hypothetical protein